MLHKQLSFLVSSSLDKANFTVDVYINKLIDLLAVFMADEEALLSRQNVEVSIVFNRSLLFFHVPLTHNLLRRRTWQVNRNCLNCGATYLNNN